MEEASGLRDMTPADFSSAVEEGTEVSASSMRQMLDLFTGKRVKALVHNQQTSASGEQYRSRAMANAVPAVTRRTESPYSAAPQQHPSSTAAAPQRTEQAPPRLGHMFWTSGTTTPK
ncbi:hypothetical protein WEB32_02540 [Streptomyces netropsis]|uniref:hypothetical protein n=1 Tax=Streptomyces netropsis TaxID=55404 RepID=UPI0030CBEA0B